MLFVGFGPIVARASRRPTRWRPRAGRSGSINARFAKPLDRQLILDAARGKRLVVTFEESVMTGGFGSGVLELVRGGPTGRSGVPRRAGPDRRASPASGSWTTGPWRISVACSGSTPRASPPRSARPSPRCRPRRAVRLRGRRGLTPATGSSTPRRDHQSRSGRVPATPAAPRPRDATTSRAPTPRTGAQPGRSVGPESASTSRAPTAYQRSGRCLDPETSTTSRAPAAGSSAEARPRAAGGSSSAAPFDRVASTRSRRPARERRQSSGRGDVFGASRIGRASVASYRRAMSRVDDGRAKDQQLETPIGPGAGADLDRQVGRPARRPSRCSSGPAARGDGAPTGPRPRWRSALARSIKAASIPLELDASPPTPARRPARVESRRRPPASVPGIDRRAVALPRRSAARSDRRRAPRRWRSGLRGWVRPLPDSILARCDRWTPTTADSSVRVRPASKRNRRTSSPMWR